MAYPPWQSINMGNEMMKIILTVLIIGVLAASCGSRTYEVSDLTKPNTIVLRKKPCQEATTIHSISVRRSGKINGTAKINLILNGVPYKTEILSGSVIFQWDGDWYYDKAEIQYIPESVTGGNLKLRYEFYD